MATTLTAGALRQLLASQGNAWQIDSNLKDGDVIQTHPLGGDLTKAIKIDAVPRIDVTAHFKAETANPFLRQLRVDRGFLAPIKLQAPGGPAQPAGGPAQPAGGPGQPAGGPSHAASVDWRNRFGWPWITKIKDQDPCESCWVFSAVGTVEAMSRIEHAVWSLRSEGDVHDGLGAQCSTLGWPTTAFDWMKAHGVADPGCWPYETQNLPYKPSSDRDGRTVKLTDNVSLSNVDDQKAWIDNVGPISACFTVYNDFFGYQSGVYKANTQTGVAGGHCIVIVGYDDSKQAWLVRNSWSELWGMSGYCWFGYGQADIDNNAKFGVPIPDTNPDPWTKRRQHNGGIIESGDGSLHMNFELVARVQNAIRHYWRDNGGDGNWHAAETFANDAANMPAMTGTTYNRNFELIYNTTASRLHHWFYDQTSGKWTDGGVFGPADADGVPGFIQGDYGAPGNFEVVVRTKEGQLAHWWRTNGPPWTWSESARFGGSISHSGQTLIQRRDNGL
ncbi:MAG TPA: C1 family peptidase, partial [Candidatus Tumulicola sp.]